MRDKEELNLDVFQSNQATTKRDEADNTVTMLLEETYQWLLIPTQRDPQGSVEWDEIRLSNSQESPVLRASRKLVHEEYLITHYAGMRTEPRSADSYHLDE